MFSVSAKLVLLSGTEIQVDMAAVEFSADLGSGSAGLARDTVAIAIQGGAVAGKTAM